MSSQDSSRSLAMTDEELVWLKAKLDLPDKVIEFLRRQPLPANTTIVAGLAIGAGFSAILAVLPAAGIFILDFGGFLADAGFLARNTIMFDQGLEALLGAIIFGIIGAPFLSFYLYRLWIRQNSSLYYKSIAFSLYSLVYIPQKGQSRSGLLTLPLAKWLLRGIDKNLPPQKYLNGFERRLAALLARPALIAYLAAFAALMLSLNSMTQVTPNGITMSPYFSVRNQNYQWQDIVSIRTGCSTVRDRKNVSHRVTYHLQFGDGRIVNLGSYTPLGATWLEALETVDGKLAAFGVSRIKENFDQGCLDAQRRSLGPQDYERLMQILE